VRIVTILARYGVEQYPRAEQEIAELFARQLPEVERDVILVDTAAAPGTVVHDRTTLLGADNRAREFSAFDRAIEWIGPALAGYDLVHFATSAFNQLYTSYLERFTPSTVAAAASRRVCLGHIDCYNQPVRVGPFLSQHWIRTCFFMLRPVDVLTLGSMVSVADGARFFSGDSSNPFRPDAPLSERYRRYILDWLTGRDIGQGVTWHSQLSLTPEGLAGFEAKTLAILNEQMLGVRLRALGCPLVDITWLGARLERGGSREAGHVDDDWAAVHWKQQLASRDRDPVILPVLQEAQTT
jgi:hypothetical protein